MKNWINCLNLAVIMLVVSLAVPMFVSGQESIDPMTQKHEKLKKELNLSDAQAAEVKRILDKDKLQAISDRERLKKDGVGLVGAARDRRMNLNHNIGMLLKPEQKETFLKTTKLSPFDRELEMWIEGLLLNGDQAFTVEGILIEYYNRLELMRPEGMNQGERMSRGGGRRGGGGGRGGGKMGRGGMGRGSSIIKELQSKKNKQIKKLLTNEQKSLHKQIVKDRKKKLKERKNKWEKNK
jgi:hypothetical protein